MFSTDGCKSFGIGIELSNGNKINWVGYRQVSIAVKDKEMSNVYWAKRYPLYSKTITKKILEIINEKL